MSDAARDCEAFIDGWWGQPINTGTSLFIVAAGMILLLRRRWILGFATVATGAGSVAFHGPQPEWGSWLHDVSIVWLLIAVAWDRTGRRMWMGGAWVVSAFAAIVVPDWMDIVQLGAALVAGWSLMRNHGWNPPTVTAASLVVVGALVGRLSRTGGPWCDPTSPLQGHGLWHLTVAAAVLIWGQWGREQSASVDS